MNAETEQPNGGRANGMAVAAGTAAIPGVNEEFQRCLSEIKENSEAQDQRALIMVLEWMNQEEGTGQVSVIKLLTAKLVQKLVKARANMSQDSVDRMQAELRHQQQILRSVPGRNSNGHTQSKSTKSPRAAGHSLKRSVSGSSPSAKHAHSVRADTQREGSTQKGRPRSKNGTTTSSSTTQDQSPAITVPEPLHQVIMEIVDLIRVTQQTLTIADVVEHTVKFIGAEAYDFAVNNITKPHLITGLQLVQLKVYEPNRAIDQTSSKFSLDCAVMQQFVVTSLLLCKHRAIHIYQLAKDFEFLSHCVFKEEQPWNHLALRLCSWAIAKSHPVPVRRDQQIAIVAASIALLSVIFETPDDAWRTDWDGSSDNPIPAAKRPKTTTAPPSPSRQQRRQDDIVFRLLAASSQLAKRLAWKSSDAFCIESSRTVIFSQIFAMLHAIENDATVQNAPPENRSNGLLHQIPTDEGSSFRTILADSIKKPRFVRNNLGSIVDSLLLSIGPSRFMWLIPELKDVKYVCKPVQRLSNGKRTAGAITVDLRSNREEDTRTDTDEADQRQSQSTPSLTDAMELNEWTISILSLSVIRPSNRLVSMVQDGTNDIFYEIIIPTLNRAMERIIDDTFTGDGRPPAASVGSKDGQLYFDGEMTPDVQLIAAVVGLYYHSLESILIEESIRLKAKSHPKVVQSVPFHRALLVCCYYCVLKAIGCSRKMALGPKHLRVTIYTLLHVFETTPYTYLKVSESFHRATTKEGLQKVSQSPIICGLPLILQQHIRRTEVQILDSVVWAREPSLSQEGSLINSITTLQKYPKVDAKSSSGSWPLDVMMPTLPEEIEDMDDDYDQFRPTSSTSTPESQFLSFVFRKVMRIAHFRIDAICSALRISKQYPVLTQIWVAFRFLLRNHVELLYDRHIDHFVLCSTYAVCKVMDMKPEVTFARLIDVYIAVRGQELGELACQRIVRQICLLSDDDDFSRDEGHKPIGNIIDLYNRIYVPKMKKHLLYSKSLKRNSLALAEMLNEKEMGDMEMMVDGGGDEGFDGRAAGSANSTEAAAASATQSPNSSRMAANTTSPATQLNGSHAGTAFKTVFSFGGTTNDAAKR